MIDLREYRDTGYYVSKGGRVFKNGKEVEGYISHGYILVSNVRVHRMVAECWICYPDLLPDNMDVHHKDKDRLNNKVTNLQILSAKEHQDLHRNGDYHIKKVIMDNEVVFNSIAEANKYLGVKTSSGSHVSDCCLGKRKTYRGHIWRYA